MKSVTIVLPVEMTTSETRVLTRDSFEKLMMVIYFHFSFCDANGFIINDMGISCD